MDMDTGPDPKDVDDFLKKWVPDLEQKEPQEQETLKKQAAEHLEEQRGSAKKPRLG